MLNFEKWFRTNEKIINFIVEKRLTKEQKQDLINEIENAKNLVKNLKASNIGITNKQTSQLYAAVATLSSFETQYKNIIDIIKTLKENHNTYKKLKSIWLILSNLKKSVENYNSKKKRVN